MLRVDPDALAASWAAFEPVLEAGRAPAGAHGNGPELAWVSAVATDLGVAVDHNDMIRIDADWDLTRRGALLDPPPTTISALLELRRRGLRIGVLSNTHALELRSWADSSVSSLTDILALMNLSER